MTAQAARTEAWLLSMALGTGGGLVSTVDDLVRWAAAVEAGVVLDDGSKAAWRDELFGERVITIDGVRAYAYSGLSDFGFGAAVGEVPERRTAVVVASNAAADPNQTVIMAALLQMALGALLELPQGRLARCTGRPRGCPRVPHPAREGGVVISDDGPPQGV